MAKLPPERNRPLRWFVGFKRGISELVATEYCQRTGMVCRMPVRAVPALMASDPAEESW